MLARCGGVGFGRLSAELDRGGCTRRRCRDVTGLSWFGPSSLAMSAAAAQYTAWLQKAAAAAGQTAAQGYAAAAAYEAAFAMTVPPPVVAANRAQLMALIATNFFGQNTAAIAATEAQYTADVGQDAAAMYAYAADSATVRRHGLIQRTAGGLSNRQAQDAQAALGGPDRRQYHQRPHPIPGSDDADPHHCTGRRGSTLSCPPAAPPPCLLAASPPSTPA